MQQSHRHLSWLSALALSLVASAAAPPPPSATLALTTCRLEHPQGLASLEAECGTLLVPENRTQRGGRQLPLFVARIPALSRTHQPEPLFVIAGGPGLGASTFYAAVAPAFARIRRDRDIIIVDQRGTGRSRPLNCIIDEAAMNAADQAETALLMRECRQQLEREHDPAQYTTSVAVQDLDAVRQALGYERIALYGSSYGTRVAQHYARRFPEHAAALLLDGAIPPTQVLGPTTPRDAEQALQQIFARCRASENCMARFGDPDGDYRALRARLAAGPVTIRAPDPRSAELRTISFSASMFAGALRLASYSAEQAALLPLALHRANALGDFVPLATQYELSVSSYESVLAYGMHNSVVCSEDVPFFADDAEARAQRADTFLGEAQISALSALCTEWPRGPVDADLHTPLASDVPALILSGGADPVTPAAFGAEAAAGFSAVLHLVLQGQGHGQLLQPCVDRIMADFLGAAAGGGDPTAIDSRCAHTLQPAPFFLSLSGPAP